MRKPRLGDGTVFPRFTELILDFNSDLFEPKLNHKEAVSWHETREIAI